MGNTMKTLTPQPKAPGVLGTAFNTYMNIDNIKNAGQNTAAAVASVKSGFQNAQKNNQYYDKLAAEDDKDENKAEKKDEKKPKKDVGKYVPALVGTALILSAGKRILETGDFTTPVKDVRDGITRVPAALVNKMRRKHPVAKETIDAVRKGAEKGIKATEGHAKPKVKNFLSNVGVGFAKGVGGIGAYMLGSKYLDHKSKKAQSEKEKEDREKLKTIYDRQNPLGHATAVLTKTASVKKGLSDFKKKMSTFGGIDWENNGKDMIVDSARKGARAGLISAGTAGLGIAIIDGIRRKIERDAVNMVAKEDDREKPRYERRGMKKTAKVLHPNDRSTLEKIIRKNTEVAVAAAATLPVAIGASAISRKLDQRARRKADEARTIERRYAALQKKREQEAKENGSK